MRLTSISIFLLSCGRKERRSRCYHRFWFAKLLLSESNYALITVRSRARILCKLQDFERSRHYQPAIFRLGFHPNKEAFAWDGRLGSCDGSPCIYTCFLCSRQVCRC